MTALLWCDKMYKNISKKLLHLTIEFFKNKRRTKGKTTQMLYDNLRGVFGFARGGGVSGLSN